jgi:hypothetical protein
MSPKRGSLSGMLAAPAEAPPMPSRRTEPPPAEVQTPEPRTPEVRSPEVREPDTRQRRRGRGTEQAPESRTPEVRTPVAQTPGLPKYLRLERKELLIWPDDITSLSILARRLNRNRAGVGERLTQNTLIRVAVRLLLSRSEELAGTTEDELLRSLGLPD